MIDVDGPPGVTDRLSIDDVTDMRDSLREWEDARARVVARQRGDRVVGMDELEDDE